MKKITPEEIKWGWCWHCKNATAYCPSCNGNACSCGCQNNDLDIPHNEKPCMKMGFWEAEDQARILGYMPQHPTEQEILNRLEMIYKYRVKKDFPVKDLCYFTNRAFEEEEYLDIKNMLIF